MRRAISFLLAILASAQCATAAEMRSIEMQYEDGRYSMVSVAWFDAGINETFHVFSKMYGRQFVARGKFSISLWVPFPCTVYDIVKYPGPLLLQGVSILSGGECRGIGYYI